MSFDSLGLSAGIMRAIRDQDYTKPTPVQSKSIPIVLAGKDLKAEAQTGTGKTAAFTLPILEQLFQDKPPRGKRKVRALVLTPTRELAAQVGESIATYGKHLPLKSTVIFGGVGIGQQIKALERGVDIVVATPGRLLDHLGQGTIDLSGVKILTLDEADRMLDMGFIHDIRKIMDRLPAKRDRQNLLFSATFSPEINKLSSSLLTNPEHVAIGASNSTADKVSQSVYRVEKTDKRSFLANLISSGGWHQVLVFARTKYGADRLAKQLGKDGLPSAAIHGNKGQGARTRALAEFKSGKVQILVATDIAARGIDIDQLPYVVNFELPNVPADYVHRIGRTARAGHTGEAVSLVSTDELGLLRDIEKLLGNKVERKTVDGYVPKPDGAAPRTQSSGQQNRRGQGKPGGSRDARGASGSGNPRRKKSGGRKKTGTPRKKTSTKRTSSSTSSGSNTGNRKRRSTARQQPAVA